MPLLIFLLCVGVASTVPVLVSAFGARALGVAVPRIELGVGRPRLEWRVGGTTICLTPWLFSSSCDLPGQDSPDLDADAPGRRFDEVHPLVRSAVALAGPLVVLGLCLLVPGSGSDAAFLQAFGQIVDGALDPLGQAQAYLAQYWNAANAAPMTTGAALLAKLMAFSLLPLPLLPGGNALLQLVRWKRRTLPDQASPMLLLSLLLILALVASWTVALVAFLAA